MYAQRCEYDLPDVQGLVICDLQYFSHFLPFHFLISFIQSISLHKHWESIGI